MINVLDITLHAAAAFIITAITVPFVGPMAVTANAAFWFGREVGQLWKMPHHPTEAFTSPQSLLEWVVPSIVGIVVWCAWMVLT